jgi:ABC-type branched-subunit amino acid transport system ATPase component
MLEISKLDAGYGKLHVLTDINMLVKPNEIIAVIGPNGAGKSTVIKSIFNLTNITKGKIIYNKENITKLKTHQLIKLGICYVNQGRTVFDTLTVQENLEIGNNTLNIERVFKKFPVLKKKRNKLARTLSGGQRQQLALSRALMQNPKVLLLDEPSLGLSPILQKQLFQTIEELRDEGIAILVVEQNAKKAIQIADRTYLLEDGKVALTGGKTILKHKKIKSIYLGGRY